MTEQEKQAVETLTRSFTRMETLYKVKCTEIEAKEEEISDLKTENAELKKRLENAVELPCKVGDTVFVISGIGIIDWQVEKIILNKDGYMICCGRAGTDDCNSFLSTEYGIWWFTDRLDAEASLETLKKELYD